MSKHSYANANCPLNDPETYCNPEEEMKHKQLPWKTGRANDIHSSEGRVCCCSCFGDGVADVNFIIRAANRYYDLLEVCKAVIAYKETGKMDRYAVDVVEGIFSGEI